MYKAEEGIIERRHNRDIMDLTPPPYQIALQRVNLYLSASEYPLVITFLYCRGFGTRSNALQMWI